ncbi:MAG: AAA family ATPase [Bacteroidales bacterium]|jgi:exodeoxyribonuclease-5|nr:AAA family ATPase [Bacteroidales bacterium]
MGVAEFFADRLRQHLGYEPTPCQARLFDTLGQFAVQYETCDMLLVSGYAGTGKTSAIAAFVRTLKELHYRYVLLAPTGRAAKVLSGFTGEKAYTIHKHIYRQKGIRDGVGEFQLNFNKAKDTFFIVDEASLISVETNSSGSGLFGSGDLLDDLVQFVRAGVDDKLILIGDRGQLPPIGLDRSPALDEGYLSRYGRVMTAELTTVVRQAAESGILTNATIVRRLIEAGRVEVPRLCLSGFDDVERIGGGELIEKIGDAVGRYGLDDIVVLCRSNKRANRYNAGIRGTVLYREERLSRGDKLMVVKNCYQFLEDVPELDFIANGDVAQLVRLSHHEERYGLHFADAVLAFPDYNDVEIKAKIVLDTLDSEQPSLSAEQQRALYQGVNEDYADVRNARKRYEKVREDPYYNALQIKYATAITGHKSQGGQWPCVFIDNPFWKEPTLDDLKWLYTAITRGVEKVYFVNFKDEFFQ